MSSPRPPRPTKLFMGLFLNEKNLINLVTTVLSEKFGEIDMVSPWADFSYTTYYEPEMGKNLKRRVIIFKPLISQTELAEIKIITNEIEEQFLKNGKRCVNIDPGYLLMERFVLASCKNFTHKIYLDKGVYADLTLIYQDRGFKILPWTFPEYAGEKMILFLEKVRKKYAWDLEEIIKEQKEGKKMIKSMTAYALAEKKENDLDIIVEIRTYNSRYLDPVVRVPHGYNEFEEKIKGLISKKISRGRIELKLKIDDKKEESSSYEINEIKAASLKHAISEIKKKFGLKSKISLSTLLGVSGILKPAVLEKNLETEWFVISGCINDALDNIIKMRLTEGEFLEKDFEKRLDFINKSIDEIETESEGLLNLYQEKLKERILTLTGKTIELNLDRIAQEAALLADKSDISEEIVRARSHVKQFNKIMKSKISDGRKLNFLLQEFNREFNTISSKAGDTKVSHIIVDVKAELEKMREQVQNVE